MGYVRWACLFVFVAAVWACTPFAGLKPDGGGGASVSSSGEGDSSQSSLPDQSEDASGVGGAADKPSNAADLVSVDESRSMDSGRDDRAEALTRDADGAVDLGAEHPTCPGAPGCKKTDGEVCSVAGECTTGVCGGRCCAAGCSCTQPSPSNLLANPGFDRDLSGWIATKNTVSRSLSDAEKCPYSGSITAEVPAGGDGLTIGQCVASTPLSGVFNFGARVNSAGGGFVTACQVVLFSGFHCDADQLATNETDPSRANFGWNQLDASLPMISGANSFEFRCSLQPDPLTATTFYLDMLYVSRAPNRY
jgi:hypothetical protein